MKLVKGKIFKSLVIGLIGAQVLLTSGCALLLIGAAAGAAVAGTAWYMGSLSGNEKATPKQVEQATIEAFKEMNIKKTMVQTSDMKSTVEGDTSDGRGVTVSAALDQNGTSKINIRVGTFGDKETSVKLYGKIREILNAQ